MFKILNGQITHVLKSNSTHVTREIESFIQTNSKKSELHIKNMFHVVHDGSCTKLSDLALKRFDYEVQKQLQNTQDNIDNKIQINIKQQNTINNLYDAANRTFDVMLQDNSPIIPIDIKKALWLS